MTSVIDRMKTWYYKKRGKTEKIYPVTVGKYRIKGEKGEKIKQKIKEIQDKQKQVEQETDKEKKQELKQEIQELKEEEQELFGEVDIVFDSFDRGRTRIIPDENDREIFELMNEPQAQGKVDYRDFDRYINEPFANVLMYSRKHFIPLKKEFATNEELGDGSGWPKLKYVLSVETMLDWAKQDWQLTKRMAENESEAWWQDRTVQAVMIAIGFGLFYIMAAWGQGNFYLEPFTEQLVSLENTLQEFMEQQELQG